MDKIINSVVFSVLGYLAGLSLDIGHNGAVFAASSPATATHHKKPRIAETCIYNCMNLNQNKTPIDIKVHHSYQHGVPEALNFYCQFNRDRTSNCDNYPAPYVKVIVQQIMSLCASNKKDPADDIIPEKIVCY